MTSERVAARVKALQLDFIHHSGAAFSHFYCPILNRDEPANLIEGHVIPQSVGASSIWVPQREDVDNFFGRTVEGNFKSVLLRRHVSPFEIWMDKELSRHHKPTLELDGKALECYFTNSPKVPAHHTPVQIVTTSGKLLGRAAVKVDRDTAKLELAGRDLQVAIRRNLVPFLSATLIKCAHLTLFSLLSYSHVFTAAGRLLSSILGGFFDEAATDDESVRRWFGGVGRMISPVQQLVKGFFKGTVQDCRMVACRAASGGYFALGVIVVVGDDTFLVFVPCDDSLIDVYFSFISEPPSSVQINYLQYHSGSVGKGEHFECSQKTFTMRFSE